MERFVDKIQKGNIYCVGVRPFVDKAQFCIGMASLFASKGNKVLHISHEMDEDTFTEKLNTTCSNDGDNINFEEVYKLTIEGLEMFASEDDYSLIVLDPFDIYALDIDLGELKEWAKKKNITVLVSKYLSRPPLESDRDHPVLSDIKFSQESLLDKFLAYVDVILFAYRKAPQSKISLTVAKNVYGYINNKIEFDN